MRVFYKFVFKSAISIKQCFIYKGIREPSSKWIKLCCDTAHDTKDECLGEDNI